jgi:ComF family protein
LELFLGANSTISALKLLPSNCSLCLQPVSSQEHCLCGLCISKLPWLRTQCRQCANPLKSNNLCPECQQKPPPYRRCVAAFEYQKDTIDKLIMDIKTNPHSPETAQLSSLLSEVITLAYQDSPMPTIMIPVPLHWRKLLMRGFNQSSNIASILSRKLKNTVILENICIRHASSSPQHLKSRKKRIQGMGNAFRMHKNIDYRSDNKNDRTCNPIFEQSVAIVDDVVTSGATAESLAWTLIKAGAKHVDIWCIARTGWHNRFD